jgi:hypothetical protein
MYICENTLLNSSYDENFSDKSCRENHSTYFTLIIFSEKGVICKVMWKKYGRARQATDDNILQSRKYAICTLEN